MSLPILRLSRRASRRLKQLNHREPPDHHLFVEKPPLSAQRLVALFASTEEHWKARVDGPKTNWWHSFGCLKALLSIRSQREIDASKDVCRENFWHRVPSLSFFESRRASLLWKI